MVRKAVAGPVRDKNRTKKKLLDAVGNILKTRGFAGLKITKIAETAGVDRKLIYDYFGSTDKLIAEYLHTADFWSNVNEKNPEVDPGDGGRQLAKHLLRKQFRDMLGSKELQKIILWELSEERACLHELVERREVGGELLFRKITDPVFGDSDVNFRAVMAVLISGVYYLSLHSNFNGTEICGVDTADAEGQLEIEKALDRMVDWAFENR
ncbi:MAG: TetR/AcrR family transcriptional regulator [Chryseobacterium sp.]|nr:MAG: TetR/AcrR family transcriptional regulator [Chryseobacterium sp.]